LNEAIVQAEMECLFFRHATDANDAFLDGGGEGSSVSVEARRACALFGWRVESERSGFEIRRALLREVPTRALLRADAEEPGETRARPPANPRL
jgi:hypothetical protein